MRSAEKYFTVRGLMIAVVLLALSGASIMAWAQSAQQGAQLGAAAEHLQQGKVEQAIRECKAALAADPRSAPAHMLLGLAHIAQGSTAMVAEAKAELQQAFDRATTTLQESMSEVREALARLDKTLVDAADNAGSKIQHQLESLRARAARAELRQSEVVSRHAQQLTNALFPNKALQEREIAAIYYLSRYGIEFLSVLYVTLQTGCHDHQVVSFD